MVAAVTVMNLQPRVTFVRPSAKPVDERTAGILALLANA
jgi:hypothetical protein